MFRIIAVTAMAALAAAQSEFSANDGSINVETREGMTVARRQQISVFDLSSVVANLESRLGAADTENSVLRAQQVSENSLIRAEAATENGALREQMAALGGSDSPLALGVQAIANDMQARTTGIIETTAANTHRLESLASAVSTAQVAVATVPSTLAATVNTMTNTMDARISTVLGSLASTATALTAAQEAGASTLTASVNTQITRVNTSIRAVNVAVAGKRSAAQHVWVGSCSSTQDGGWREYCFDRVQVDTARPMFRKENNNRMRSIVAGYYHVYFSRMLVTCNWEHTLIYFDGNHRVHTHGWKHHGSWVHAYAQMVYPLAANKQFWARAWNNCWSVWNTSPQYSHFFAQYAGAIPA